MNEMGIDYTQYDDEYSGAEPKTSGSVPDGEYNVTVVHCGPGKSKKKGTPQVQWAFTVEDGDHSGRRILKDQNITPQGMGYVKADFDKVFPANWKLSQCMASLDSLVGVKLKVKVVTRSGDQYPTVYINERIGDAPPVQTPAPAPTTTDDIPF